MLKSIDMNRARSYDHGTALDDYLTKIQKLQKEVLDIYDTLERKESKMNFNNLLERFNVFSEIDTIQKLETHYLPKVHKFTL